MRKNNVRSVGHTYERQLRLEFRELGWTQCETSRYASKMTDDANVDFVNTEPFNFQAKRWKSAPSYHEVLKSMPAKGLNVIIHKRPNKGEIVVMNKDTFYLLIKLLNETKILKTL